jgi:hypothetical protein
MGNKTAEAASMLMAEINETLCAMLGWYSAVICTVGTGAIYSEVKRPGREANQSPIHDFVVMNVRNCASASLPPYVVTAFFLTQRTQY